MEKEKMSKDKFILICLDDESKNNIDKYFSQYHQDKYTMEIIK